jgi:hypothetical protein
MLHNPVSLPHNPETVTCDSPMYLKLASELGRGIDLLVLFDQLSAWFVFFFSGTEI